MAAAGTRPRVAGGLAAFKADDLGGGGSPLPRLPGRGRGSPVKRRVNLARLVDEEATQQRLQDLLLTKNTADEDDDDGLGRPSGLAIALGAACSRKAAASTSRNGSKGLLRVESAPAITADGGGGGASAAGAALGAAPGWDSEGQGSGASTLGGVAESAVPSGRTSLSAAPPPGAHPVQQQKEFERERQRHIDQICSDNPRHDVQEWVGKIFAMKHQAKLAGGKDRRRRRMRFRTGSAASDAGMSGFSEYTCETGQSGTSGTPLVAAGGSIAAASSRRPRSVAASEDSMVVHLNVGDPPLSVQERVQAYVARRIPELEQHVNQHVERRSDALQREVDEEMAGQFLLQTAQRKVFDSQANYLRWQNLRHQVLQKRLDTEMQAWILEAVESWDQTQAMEKQDKEVSETDLIFDYITKRAAHINSEKLPAQIPIFRALHASYSLPSMWRDKYA